MSYADELRNKSSSYDPEQIRIEKMEKYIEDCIRECVLAIRRCCDSKAERGKNSISGYLDVIEDWEYGYHISAEVREDKSWEKGPRQTNRVPAFDFGGRGARKPVARSGKEQKAIAEKIQIGIHNELCDSGFTSLSIDIVKRNNPKDLSFLGLSLSHIYSMFVSIKW